MRHLTSIALVALLAMAGVSAQDAVPKELVPLQGTWVITSANGQDAAGQGTEIALVVKGNTYQQTINGTVAEHGTLKLDPSKTPTTIDLAIIEGDDAGKAQLGIIAITGDTIKGKFSPAGLTTRPTDFELDGTSFVFAAKKKA